MTRETTPLVVLCGAAMLIPLPWVDGWVERRVTRRLLQEVARERGVTLADEHLDVLVGDRSSLVLGVVQAVVVWPLKKLFKTVLYFLTVKDVLDGVARAAHRVTLVDDALARGLLPARVEEVRRAMDHALERVMVSPVVRPLYGHDRPELPTSLPEDPTARAVRWLQRQGGGAVVLETYRRRLATLLPAIPDPVAEAE